MKYLPHIGMLIAFIASFIFGWQFNPSQTDVSLTKISTIDTTQETHSAIQSKQESDARTSTTQQNLSPSSETDDSKTEDPIRKLQAEIEELDQLMKDGVYIADLETQIDDLIALFKEIDVRQQFSDRLKIANFIQESPELYTAFLDRYPSLPREDQWLIESMLLSPDSLANKFRENYIVDKLKAGQHSSTWLNVLSQQGIRESSTLDFLVEQISYITEPSDLAAAITASSSIFEPSMISAELALPRRDDVAELYKPYFDSSEESVRTAALGTLVAYPRPDEVDIIGRALTDHSEGYKREAIDVLMQRSFQSNTVQTKLYEIIRNTDEPSYIRRQASMALNKNATTRPPQDVIDIANELFRRR